MEDEQGLVTIFWGEQDFIVSVLGVQGCNELGFSKGVDALVHSIEFIGVLNRHRIFF